MKRPTNTIKDLTKAIKTNPEALKKVICQELTFTEKQLAILACRDNFHEDRGFLKAEKRWDNLITIYNKLFGLTAAGEGYIVAAEDTRFETGTRIALMDVLA